jgi:hypothetical protein
MKTVILLFLFLIVASKKYEFEFDFEEETSDQTKHPVLHGASLMNRGFDFRQGKFNN